MKTEQKNKDKVQYRTFQIIIWVHTRTQQPHVPGTWNNHNIEIEHVHEKIIKN